VANPTITGLTATAVPDMSGNRPSGSVMSIPFRNNVLFCISGMRSVNLQSGENTFAGDRLLVGF
jgi:hypothetical protein